MINFILIILSLLLPDYFSTQISIQKSFESQIIRISDKAFVYLKLDFYLMFLGCKN